MNPSDLERELNGLIALQEKLTLDLADVSKKIGKLTPHVKLAKLQSEVRNDA